MSISITINPVSSKVYLQNQKAALVNSIYFSDYEKNKLNQIYDEQIMICDEKIAHELDVQDAINL